MALIKCPECGREVSDKATACPHCGFNIANLNHCEECNAIISESEASCPECGCPTPWSRKCPECGNYVLPTEETCPECGFDMVSHFGRVNTVISDKPAKPEPQNESIYDSEENDEKSSKSKWIGIIAITLAIACGAGWWYWNKVQHNDTAILERTDQDSPITEYDGIYEWSVLASDHTSTYKEELGCEISNGEIVTATWYSPKANSQLSGHLDGNILYLEGKHTLFPDMWIKCAIDLRTGRGTISSAILPITNVRYERLNPPTQSQYNQSSNTNSLNAPRIDGLLDKLEYNISTLESLAKRKRNGENVDLETDAYMMVNDSRHLATEINSLSNSFSKEQQERLNHLIHRYQQLL